ncbi:hypothetical protein ACH5RR_003454 [Cinchona calisaya]|uniref:RNase H type-1 domain-containing protein n=1 Tax=Cinchona calisaya TaxID=153742 RepID=A0ABD3AV95_9GENT
MAVLDDKTSSTTRIIADIYSYLVNISSAHPFKRVSTADDLLLSRGICKQLLQTKPKKVLAVKWDCPPHGCLKLNVDGASKGNPGMAAGGGIIRDHYGQCIRAFSNSYQQQTNLQVEALALVDGLNMCHNLQVRSMVVEPFI